MSYGTWRVAALVTAGITASTVAATTVPDRDEYRGLGSGSPSALESPSMVDEGIFFRTYAGPEVDQGMLDGIALAGATRLVLSDVDADMEIDLRSLTCTEEPSLEFDAGPDPRSTALMAMTFDHLGPQDTATDLFMIEVREEIKSVTARLQQAWSDAFDRSLQSPVGEAAVLSVPSPGAIVLLAIAGMVNSRRRA